MRGAEIQIFNGQIDAFAAKIGVSLEIAIKKLALQIYNGVTLKTPVDTGRARASWQITIGDISTEVAPEMGNRQIQKLADKDIHHDTSSAQEAAKMQDFNDKTLIGRFEGLGLMYIQPVYITNALSYIIYLENGSSDQAPQGMVALTLAEVEAGLRGALG